MQKGYNLYNLEPEFKKYLFAEKISPVSLKNYLSDFRHFAGWMEFYIKANSNVGAKFISPEKRAILESPLQEFINEKTISEYRTYLIENNLPRKTINRRLSTVRKFCSFGISQGWLKENPGKKVSNISFLSSRSSERNEHVEGSKKKDSSTEFTLSEVEGLGITHDEALEGPGLIYTPRVILSTFGKLGVNSAKNLAKRVLRFTRSFGRPPQRDSLRMTKKDLVFSTI